MSRRKSHVRTSHRTVRSKGKVRTVHRNRRGRFKDSRKKVDELYAPCRSKAQLSDRLTRIFQGKLIHPISPQQLQYWYKGELPVGVPLPPQPIRNRYPTPTIAQWVKDFIMPLPDWGYNGNGNGSEIAKHLREKKEEAQLAKYATAIREEQIQAGKFKSVEVFNRHMADFFAEINSYVSQGESILSNTVTEFVNALTLDDSVKLSLLAAIRDGSRKAVDNFRTSLRQSLERHKETETLETK